MATLSTTQRKSAGDMTLFIFTLTTVADTETFASGLGSNVLGYWANAITNEGTQGEEGVNVANSSGTFTFYLKTTGTVLLYVLATV